MYKVKGVILSNRVISYLETALWSSTACLPCSEDQLDCMGCMGCETLDGIVDGEPLDNFFDIEDFDGESLRVAVVDCDEFFDELEDEGLLESALEYADEGRIAHDFWLTRNHHGAGFWDGDYGDIGDQLTHIAHGFSSVDIMVCDDGSIQTM